MITHRPSKVFLIACLAVILSVVDCAPFNAEGGFYNGDAASAPSFDIQVGFVFKNMEIMKQHGIADAIRVPQSFYVRFAFCVQQFSANWIGIVFQIDQDRSFKLTMSNLKYRFVRSDPHDKKT